MKRKKISNSKCLEFPHTGRSLRAVTYILLFVVAFYGY